ncbi:STAS domain-containing protein [Saccharothrix obliqua]|uniref:STAS domain-containing protein n=1 Tax=Saccharothrix obliqua TaxID=2861747 RepID=UPI001C5D97C2|nr:STAS domain-containing protein [Saccharothrix obliqua]MBW4720549.1 STAS domain-containing protein [Saccharothrix obliqua]
MIIVEPEWRDDVGVVGEVAVVHLSGDIDMAVERDVLGDALSAMTPRTRTLVLDLTDVTFFGSHGIGMVLAAHTAAERHGIGFAVVASSRVVLRPLEITDLTHTVAIYPSVAEAVHGIPHPR